MGIKERKEREKAKMRKTILETAMTLFIKKGMDNISIRNIAKIIEYSPATIYLYFNDKNEILQQMRALFIEDFYKKLNEFSFIKEHSTRLKNMAVSWLEYAIQQPEKYTMIFMPNGSLSDNRIFQYMKEIVFNCQNDNALRRMPQEDATTMIMTYLHGISYFAISEKFEFRTKTELKDYLSELINRFLNSMNQPISV